MELSFQINLLGVWIMHPSPKLVVATVKKKVAAKKRPAKKKRGVARPKSKSTVSKTSYKKTEQRWS
jgi:hypothetical protein